MTHGDSDHTGSALAILENFRIGQVLVGDTLEKKEIELNIINEAKKRGIPITKVSAGMQWEEAGHKFLSSLLKKQLFQAMMLRFAYTASWEDNPGYSPET